MCMIQTNRLAIGHRSGAPEHQSRNVYQDALCTHSEMQLTSRSFRRITAVGITSKPAPRANRGQHQSAKALWQYGAPAGADRKIYRKPWF